MEVIVLAGGLGTRLQSTIGPIPKCMAPVNGQPFLASLLRYLDTQPCTRAVLSLGYKHRLVTDWLEQQDLYLELDYIVESEPLGTGGGILAAIEECETDDVVVINGDTLFLADLRKMMSFHKSTVAHTTLALKEMQNFDRYGIVNTNAEGLITSFEEKRLCEKGSINGGIYIINRAAYLKKPLHEKFSFEKEYLEKFVSEKHFYGLKCDNYFIDIGVPEDYSRAQTELKNLLP